MRIYRISRTTTCPDILYRSSNSQEAITNPMPVASYGIFFSDRPQNNYGSLIGKYQVVGEFLSILQLESRPGRLDRDAEKLLEKFNLEYGWESPENLNITGHEDELFNNRIRDTSSTVNLWSLFLYPTQAWVDFLKKKGYHGTTNDGHDFCLFDSSYVQFMEMVTI